MLSFSQLAGITQGTLPQLPVDRVVKHYFIDSRKAIYLDASCFFAIRGERHDGHDYVRQLYDGGIRQFVVETKLDWQSFPEASFFLTSSSLHALQDVAAFHRHQFNLPVIGITGSNAKTIIKEWLHQLLSPEFSIVKTPGSYNSQLGVPLSVLQIRTHHQLGIFEAGISLSGEMQALRKIIDPTIGIFTNIGSAHDAGFKSRKEKILEKIRLFESCPVILFRADEPELREAIQTSYPDRQLLSWGETGTIPVHFLQDGYAEVIYKNHPHIFLIPFTDAASQENLMHCIILMLYLGLIPDLIRERIGHLKAVPMRLELKQGINHSLIIDDSYNNDVAGLQISLNFLTGQQKEKKMVVISDILQSGITEEKLASQVAEMLVNAGVQSVIAIGPVFLKQQKYFKALPSAQFFPTVESFLQDLDESQFQSALILVKGARAFQLEKVVRRLQRKVHGTVMEINLDALIHNLNYFKTLLRPGVKTMVMVKAFAYGSGSEEIANLLQYHQADYLGVAYADEGVELRKNRISLPIMVMNPSEDSFETLLAHGLEPEIYSIRMLKSFVQFLEGRPCKIHLKIDTGMHRLGISTTDIGEAITILRQHPTVEVASVFSHLAGADEAIHDDFTRSQANLFKELYETLAAGIKSKPLRHILNSPGILRFPDYQFEMVRLGIGLYGVDPTGLENKNLQPVATLKTRISQIKKIPAGDTIGYGRRGLAETELMIATIAIGYADGFSRKFGGGAGVVLINGQRAPIVGNVCMDMTMVDITGIDANEGDEVIIFGDTLSIYDVAKRGDTIPYEILTNTSERVKRIFYAESI